MSTKAYEGVRFRARTLTALVKQLTDAFVEFDRLGQLHEAAFVATHAATEHDVDWWGHKRDTTGNIGAASEFSVYASRAWREMRKRQREIKATGMRDPGVDSMVEIQVWLGPGKHLYGYVHSEVDGIRAHLLSSGIAEDFAYWNNTDRDERVSAAQWRHRQRVWDQLFDGKCGKSFQFLSPDHSWPDNALVMAALPDARVRSRRLTEDAMFPVWAEAAGIREPSGSAVMRFLHDCKDDDGSWRERFDAHASALEAELPPLTLG